MLSKDFLTQTSMAIAAVALLTAGCKQAAPPETTPAPAPTAAAPAPAEIKQINGQDIVKLVRKPTSNGAKPEFLTATIFPGRGFNLFQITANIPGKGEVEILASPTVAEAASRLTDSGPDKFGNQSYRLGGVFLVPYPNRIRGKLSEDGQTITTTWKGKTLTLPANSSGKLPNAEVHAMHGLILERKADDVQVSADGETLTGTIHAGDFGGHWLSKTDLTFEISLKDDAVATTITAKNVGDEPEPIAIGWHPYFNIPSGDRKQARLHVPADSLALVNNYDDVFPTGQIVPVKTYEGGKYDFTAPTGKALADTFLDDNWSKLKRTDGQVVVDVVDPASNYGVHIEGLSPEIKTVQVYAPVEKSFVAVEEQYNFGDPFGKEWKGVDTGFVTLKPGQSTTWKTRLELFTPAK
jgi:galactose mutarotase-like enzyme